MNPKPAAKLLRELIALPSVNPAFALPKDPRAGESRVADFLADAAHRAGLDVFWQEVSPGRRNLLAALTPAGEVKHRILLAPHLDTVNGAPHQFKPVLKNGRLHGRGACDTKGCVATYFATLTALAQHGPRPAHTEIIFAGLVDEENGQTGSRALAKSPVKADLAIVGEPTRCRIVTAHKGDLWLRLETRGRSAHGARPELGRNAVHAMARVVQALEVDYAASLRRRRHPLLGHATVNVGTIRGGVQANIVPDHCEIIIDRRTLPDETQAGVHREIKTLLRRHGLKATIADTKDAPCPALETDPSHPLVRQLLRAAGQSRPLGVDYFCDAAILSTGGTPSIVFGPGDIAQAHTADEWIALSQLDRATAILRRFLLSLP